MNKKFSFIIFTFLLSWPLYLLSDNGLFKDLTKYELPHQYVGSMNDNIKTFQKFIGDTLTLHFDSKEYIEGLTTDHPDTIWLKKRPKQNPKLGKHYILNDVYKGIRHNEMYVTPSDSINGKQLILFRVFQCDKQYYYEPDALLLTFIVPNTLEQIYIRIPESPSFGLYFISQKASRILKNYIGHEIYYAPQIKEYSATKPEYYKYTIDSGKIGFKLYKKTLCFGIESDCRITLTDKNGIRTTTIPRYVEASSYKYSPFVSEKEYEGRFKMASITSDVDMNIFNEELDFPFSFRYIMGKANYYSGIYQTIDPSKSYNSPSTYLPDKIIAIGDEIRINGTDYYKACYNGKAFFIPQNNVTLLEESKSELDTLRTCSKEIRDKFFHNTLAVSKLFFLHTIEENLDIIKTYSKYGLAIPSWRVYDMSEYTEGTGIKIKFYNPTNSTIKYITLTIQGYNAVDDPYGRPVTKKCIGPIDPDDTVSYDFEYVWFSDIVEYAKIKSIVVQYKNGTTKKISNVNNIIFPNDLSDWFLSGDPVGLLN